MGTRPAKDNFFYATFEISVDEKSGDDNQKGSDKGFGRDLSISRSQDFPNLKKFLEWGSDSQILSEIS
jgi:hypothetical protein